MSSHLRAADYLVRPVEDVMKANVEAWHYSRSASKVSVYRHGLYRRLDEETLVGPLGVALWLPPTKAAARAVAGDDWRGVLNLSRLAVEPGMPTNSASFLLGRSMRLVDRRRRPVLLTYADTRHGHTGAIYKATNWRFDGEVKAGALWLGPNGEQRGMKRGPRNLTRQEMEEAGFTYHPPVPKLRFVHDARRS